MGEITDQKTLRAALRERVPRDYGQLLPALHFLQHEFGYLPDWAMEVVGWHLGIPASEVFGAATSYTELRLNRPGRQVIRVCTGLGCRINGGKELLAAAESALGIRAGETTAYGSVTLDETACGFLCGLAPAVEIDGAWQGRGVVPLSPQLFQPEHPGGPGPRTGARRAGAPRPMTGTEPSVRGPVAESS